MTICEWCGREERGSPHRERCEARYEVKALAERIDRTAWSLKHVGKLRECLDELLAVEGRLMEIAEAQESQRAKTHEEYVKARTPNGVCLHPRVESDSGDSDGGWWWCPDCGKGAGSP